MKLLTVREADKELALGPKTVRKLIKASSLRGVRISREWRIEQDDFDLFVKRRMT